MQLVLSMILPKLLRPSWEDEVRPRPIKSRYSAKSPPQTAVDFTCPVCGSKPGYLCEWPNASRTAMKNVGAYWHDERIDLGSQIKKLAYRRRKK